MIESHLIKLRVLSLQVGTELLSPLEYQFSTRPDGRKTDRYERSSCSEKLRDTIANSEWSYLLFGRRRRRLPTSSHFLLTSCKLWCV